MNIAYIVTRAAPIGGAQIHVRDLAVAMQAQGHSPAVLTGGGGSLVDDLRAKGIPVVVLRHLAAPMRPLRDLRALREIRAALRELRPDLITAHSAKAGTLGRFAGRSLHVPVVVTVHGWACAPGTPPLQAAVSRRVERFIRPLAGKIITVSEFDRQFGLHAGIVTEDDVVTVHNGMPDFTEPLRADPGKTPARLVMVARFEPQKDHPILLAALAGLQELPWELDLVGDGPLMGEMQSLAARLGIGDRVRFLGQRMDVHQILAQAQVGVLASNWEGFPLSILEAMRAGLPVVASSVGGVGEAVQDDDTGYLIPRGDVELLKDRIGRLLADPALRVRLGGQGRHRYQQHFTLDHMVAGTLAVYRDVLGRETGGKTGVARSRPPEGHRMVEKALAPGERR
ncbi:MAG: glycosyltransferase family 4 protein [Gemmatimonadales bacterium]